MKLFGIGTDIIKTSRLKKSITNKFFLKRLFHEKEISRCKNLNLVILNGCSTVGIVEALIKIKIPVIIATNSPVDDNKAMMFSTEFFKHFGDGESIYESYIISKH